MAGFHRTLRALARLGTTLALALVPALAGGPPPPADPPHRPYVRVYKEQDGLPQPSVFSLAVDREGRAWAGTVAGIARHDGLRWGAVETPPSRYVTQVNGNAMTTLSDGSVWVGTRFRGILAFHGGRCAIHDTTRGLPSNNVNAILESAQRDGAGRPVLFAATHDKGLARYQDDHWHAVGGEGSLVDQRMYCLLEREGELWVGTGRGVWILKGGRWRPFEGNEALGRAEVRAMVQTPAPDGGRILWIGTEKNGLFRWDGRKVEALPLQAMAGTREVRALAATPEGTVYVGTAGAGVARIRDDRWTILSQAEGLPSNFIRSLALTWTGSSGTTLWVGTEGHGIGRLREGGWNRVHPPWPVVDGRVPAFWETEDPATREPVLWMGSSHLGRFFHGAWTFYHPQADTTSDTLRSIIGFPGEQDLYMGFRNTLQRFRHGRFEEIRGEGPAAAGQVRILETSVPRHVLYVGTSRGLMKWDGHTLRSLPPPPGDPEPSVRALAMDGARLWVGTDMGLSCLENDAWLSLPVTRAYKSLGVDAILPPPPAGIPGPRGLVIGTYGAGLHWIKDLDNPLTAGIFNQSNTPALHHDLVLDLVLDRQGRVTITTPRGVTRMDPRQEPPLWDDFTLEDGLPSLDCVKGGLYRDSAGRVWVGTEGDPAWLDADHSMADRTPKPLVWESASLGGRPVLPGAALSHDFQGLHFEFRLVSPHREQDSRYRVQLEGLQKTPGEWSPEASISFPGLPAGHYTFLVWGRDHGGNLSGPIRFPFRVKAPLWLTPYAFGLYAILSILFIQALLVVRTRMLAQRNRHLEARIHEATKEILRHQEEQEQFNQQLLNLNLEKTKFMGIAAHDLKNPLSTITLVCDGLLSGDLAECPEEVRKWMTRVAVSARQMTALIHEFLDVNAIESGGALPLPRELPVREILDPVRSLFEPRLRAKAQALLLEDPDPAMTVHVDPNHMRQILENLISNASKFSPQGSPIRLAVREAGDHLRFQVTDQGPGLSDEDRARLFTRFAHLSAKPTGGESSSGLGLSIVKHLVDANRGRIWVESEPGRGCVFTVEIPARASAPPG